METNKKFSAVSENSTSALEGATLNGKYAFTDSGAYVLTPIKEGYEPVLVSENMQEFIFEYKDILTAVLKNRITHCEESLDWAIKYGKVIKSSKEGIEYIDASGRKHRFSKMVYDDNLALINKVSNWTYVNHVHLTYEEALYILRGMEISDPYAILELSGENVSDQIEGIDIWERLSAYRHSIYAERHICD